MFLTILGGLPLTVLITVGSLVFGTVLALPLLFGLQSKNRLLWLLSRGLVDILRGIPSIVWLFALYYGITSEAWRLSAVQAGIGALGLVAAAYLAEILRGALKSVSAGQWEAAHALGLSRWTTWRSVIGPQVWRTALPAYTNVGIALLKDSSLVSIIGVTEMLYRSGQLARESSAGIFVYLFAAALYVAMSVPLGMLSRSLDVRMLKVVAR